MRQIAKFRISLLAVLMAVSTGLAAELRIGVVNTAKVLELAPQAEASSETLKAEFAPREAEVKAEQEKLKEMEDRLKRDGDIMSDEERRKFERDIVNQQREIKRAAEEFNEDFNLRRNEEYQKLTRSVGKAIIEFAKEGEYDLVLESVMYAGEKVDVTEQIIMRLKDQKPLTSE